MKTNKIFGLVLCVMCVVAFSTTGALAKSKGFVDLELTEKQVEKLQPISEEFTNKQSVVHKRIQTIEEDMSENLRKQDRFASETLHRIRISRFNMLLRSLGEAHGELLKIKVSFLVKARNVLKKEQMALLIESVFDFVEELADFEDDDILGIDLTDPDWDIDLTVKQERSLIDYYAHRDIQRIRLLLAFEHQLLDLEELILKGNRISAASDDRISELGNIAARIVDNEVQAFITTKDILSIPQKKEMLMKIILATN